MVNSYRNKNRLIPKNLITASVRARPVMDNYDDFKSNKRNAIRAAKDLGYGQSVVSALEAATTDGELEHIMRTARHEKFK